MFSLFAFLGFFGATALFAFDLSSSDNDEDTPEFDDTSLS
ncbi:hypothetical protein EDD53_0876 [Pacificibacter maritimus]|uniref:Uncharacterized protein n=1 Tax=Pacificibacter maritimus TaxID=762213 RepID=A0A3N4UNZ4_9RHOB|nr:hypothetical protein EDD53_0876 [Pacificibacter maritimus]